jgi:hypothetical protein
MPLPETRHGRPETSALLPEPLPGRIASESRPEIPVSLRIEWLIRSNRDVLDLAVSD